MDVTMQLQTELDNYKLNLKFYDVQRIILLIFPKESYLTAFKYVNLTSKIRNTLC